MEFHFLEILDQLTQIFIFPVCLSCGGENRLLICSDCENKIIRVPTHRNAKDHLTMSVRAYGEHDGVLKELIRQFKFENKRRLCKPFARFLAQMIPLPMDCIIPVPLHIKRLRERGYNQMALVARELSKRLEIPCHFDVLKKPFESVSQTELSKSKRKANVRGTFAVVNSKKIMDKKVLLIDDVFTTGATVQECRKELLRAGAFSVFIATLAKRELS